jgi:hypothetical protein
MRASVQNKRPQAKQRLQSDTMILSGKTITKGGYFYDKNHRISVAYCINNRAADFGYLRFHP